MTALRDQLARFHAAITGGAPLDSARELVEHRETAPHDRGARADIDVLDRLRVYEYAYVARLRGVLAHDFPKLARVLGHDVHCDTADSAHGEHRDTDWNAHTLSYLRAYPPSSFSLRELGAHIADHLERLAATATVTRNGDEVRNHLLAHLARLERARTEVFDGPDAIPLSRDDLAAMDPAEFPSLRLQLVPSSRVVEMTTNADEVWDAIENDRDVPAFAHVDHRATPIDTDRRTVLVWRRELTVVHRTLDPDEARVIRTMGVPTGKASRTTALIGGTAVDGPTTVVDGTTFGAACELLDEATAAERAIELLVRWLDAQILRRS